MTHFLSIFESFQIVGAFWYLLAIDRNNACWQEVCSDDENCKRSLSCSKQTVGHSQQPLQSRLNSTCSVNAQFDYGIFENALSNEVVTPMKFVSKYCYCLWWGLQNLRYVNYSIFYLQTWRLCFFFCLVWGSFCLVFTSWKFSFVLSDY